MWGTRFVMFDGLRLGVMGLRWFGGPFDGAQDDGVAEYVLR